MAPDGEALVEEAGLWARSDPDPETRREIELLVDAGDLEGLRSRFGSGLAFGTAGLRGRMGAGPARVNRATVRLVTAGLARYLAARGGRRVVVGFDARHHSGIFAEDAAGVLAAAGLQPLRLPRALPTPVLAYAVRRLGAAAGVMITASHNPAEDNGYKIYGPDGAQVIPPADREIADAIAAVGSLEDVALAAPPAPIGDGVVSDYLDAIIASSLHTGHRDATLVYTPLHGVGGAVLCEALARAGFPVPAVVAAQREPDGDFPTVTKPNPEEPGTLDLLLAEAARTSPDLAIANDPDADRLSVSIPTAGGWRVLSGDEVGALLASHLLAHAGEAHGRLLVTSIVSSSLLGRMAAEAGADYAETLTGFKWLMHAAEDGDRAFLFGYEEALGYAVSDVVRDKDGISAALTMAEMAAEAKAGGWTLAGRLDDLARRHGLHLTAQRSLELDGAGVDRLMRRARQDPPATLAGGPVATVADLAAGTVRRADGTTGSSALPRADVVVWRADDATRVVLRPSGTEPKVKLYFEVVETVADGDVDRARAAGGARMQRLMDDVGRRLEL